MRLWSDYALMRKQTAFRFAEGVAGYAKTEREVRCLH